ncbi:MAG TPA: efflux RND transporter periplasmic adaptor subunit [Candidatus Hydrogenedentes bacterium]|nr:efflux RND transporter periplasmic adaptor subunit [Candidatus Hydrogenedentota bacterium]
MKRFLLTVTRWILLLVILAAFVMAGRAVILKKRQALSRAPRYQAPAVLVDTMSVRTGNLDEAHDYLAVVEPVQSTKMTAQVTATIESVVVDEGDRVSPGQVVITLDHRQVDAQVDAVRAQISQARAELEGNRAAIAALEASFAYWSREAERDTHLAQNETIPLSQAEATVDKKNDTEGKLRAARQKSAAIEQEIRALEARQAELETTRSYYEIQSPYEGVVTSRFVDPGDQAAPGKPLLIIESAGATMIAFDVPQADLPAVKPGFLVTFQGGDERITHAAISRVYPSLDRARMARAEVVLDETQANGLTSGEYLTVTVVYAQHQNVPLIPVDALVESSDLENRSRVFVVEEDGVLRAREVEVLGMTCDEVAVGGLREGDRVVTNAFLGWARLADGMKVETR